jgi:hypothetical protein
MAELAEIVNMTGEQADHEVARRVAMARQKRDSRLGIASSVSREGAVLAKKLTTKRRLHWMHEISSDCFEFPGLSGFFTELRALNYAEEIERQRKAEQDRIVKTGRP